MGAGAGRTTFGGGCGAARRPPSSSRTAPATERTVSTCGRYRRRCGWRSATDCNAGSMPKRTRTTPRSIKPLLDHLAASGAESLLERPLTEWLAGLPAGAALHSPRAFLSYAIDCLLDLRDGTGWDSEYQRDVWLLRRLGIAGHGAPAWISLRCNQSGCGIWPSGGAAGACRGIGLGQLRKDRIAIVRFSRFTPGLANSAGPGTLDRAALEAYLARLAVEIGAPQEEVPIVCVGPGKEGSRV